ncbi:hypothetical protein L3X38_045236 [Prunus dulcis]|uniref:Uncharacterized protein n=1 Tax=Prunus dulcis TaxID=3755 RepID=A0AAD4YP02_PRUDU|nr:hypothetical protein L3X38_045236 [Prunus dulcis]
MKRVWKLSDAAQSELLCRHRCSSKTKTLPPYNLTLTNSPNYRFTRDVNAQNHSSSSPSSSSPTSFPSIIGLFIDKPSPQDLRAREDLVHKVTQLRDELVQNIGDSDEFVRVLEEKGSSFFSSYGNGYAVVELMNQLRSWPHLAVEVFYWRRKQSILDDSNCIKHSASHCEWFITSIRRNRGSTLFTESVHYFIDQVYQTAECLWKSK